MTAAPAPAVAVAAAAAAAAVAVTALLVVLAAVIDWVASKPPTEPAGVGPVLAGTSPSPPRRARGPPAQTATRSADGGTPAQPLCRHTPPQPRPIPSTRPDPSTLEQSPAVRPIPGENA